MSAPNIERFPEEASALLQYYSFDLAGYSIDFLISGWQQTYSASWIRAAVIEALYQGRYKAVSVEQILLSWLRRGKPLRHFNHEFERIVCNQSDRKRTRKNCPVLPLSEASLSTSCATSSVEPGSDHFNPQSYSPSNAKTESDPPAEFTDQQLVSQISEHSASKHSPELPNESSAQNLAPSGDELDLLGDPTESSPMKSSNNHDDDDFEPPDNQALINQIWQFSSRSAPPLESQYKPKSDNLDPKLPTGKNSKHYHSIHQFKPESDRSDFYLKLLAVSRKSHHDISNPID